MQKILTVFLFLLFLFSSSSVRAEEYENHVKAAQKQLAILKKECRSEMNNYPNKYPDGSTSGMQEAYGVYIKCMKNKIDILSKGYLINDNKGLPGYAYRDFMESLNKASENYGDLMSALFLNNVTLLNPDTAERGGEGTEAHWMPAMKLAEFIDNVAFQILEHYQTSKTTVPDDVFKN